MFKTLLKGHLPYEERSQAMNMESNSWTTATVVVAAILVCIVIVIGILGNLMVVLVSIKGNRVRTKGRAFIASLAIADTVASTNLIFMLVSAVNYGKWVFGDTFCQLNGFVASQFVASSTYSLQAISVDRYFIVVKQSLYRRVFTTRNQLLIIALIWCIPIPLAIGPVLGWSQYEFQTGKCLCLYDYRTSISYSIAVVLVTVLIPLFVMCLCYFQIFKQVRHHSNQVDTTVNNTQNMNVQEVKITKTLFVVIAAYVACFAPAAIANLIKIVIPTFEIPLWIDILSMILVFFNHANNPIIYGALNKQYRKAFKDIFRNSVGFGDFGNGPVLADTRVLPRLVVHMTRPEDRLGTGRDTGVDRVATLTTHHSTIQ